MKRFSSIFAGLMLLIFPVVTFAVFTNPADLLMSLGYDGKPREFDYNFYANLDQESDVEIKGNIQGAMEGKDTDNIKLKINGDISIKVDDESVNANARMIIHQKKLYMRLDNLELNFNDFSDSMMKDFEDELNKVRNKWIYLDLEDSDFRDLEQVGNYWDMYGPIFEELDMTPAEGKQLISDVIGALFNMEHMQFKEGHSYSLGLHPQFLERAFEVIYNKMNGHDLGDYLNEPEFNEFLAGLQGTQDLIADSINLKIKLDTNVEDQFRYAKYYLSFNMPEAGVSASIEGKAQHRILPVYLDVPVGAENLEDIFSDMFPEVEYLDEDYTEFGEEEDWEEEDLYDEWEWEDDDWEDESEWDQNLWDRPQRSPLKQLPQIISVECAELPMDAYYMDLVRKGYCQSLRYSKRTLNDELRGKAKMNPAPRRPIWSQ
ncbi:hypothetical protein KJ652_00905 [Patescibacteria group bacterium]|nr:hypothetical protein [Patescibacteria group bacterium]MBU1123129.1 hypothetical protein [Patescibacteria group bacterium]MBU1911047.1 hypothetical protein [Patescibacteria group bacterium]